MSNVTGENLELLRTFLSLLSGRMHSNEDKPAEFQIDETYSVPVSEVGVVVFRWCGSNRCSHIVIDSETLTIIILYYHSNRIEICMILV